MATPAAKYRARARALCLYPALLAALVLAVVQVALAADSAKHRQTGTFWQKDPEAGFEGDGSNFCAPTSVANGLLYLAQARGLTGLVDGTDHKSQIALIKALAEHMDTDPDIGTNPSNLIDGLNEYLHAKGFQLANLEMAGWRRLKAEHEAFRVAEKPTLAWLRAAADDPDTILILNNGWYREGDDGYTRKGGHFVIAVGAGPGASELQVHNPALEPEEQKSETSVVLAPLGAEIVAEAKSNGVDQLALDGYFKMQGPGLPFTAKKAAFAALDFAIAFKVKK